MPTRGLPSWLKVPGLGHLKTFPPSNSHRTTAKAHLATSLPEVLHGIIQYSMPAEYTRTMDYSAEHWSLTDRLTRDPLFETEKADLRTVLAACLVCKEWYAAGVIVLYARPVITTARQRRRFCRTLQGNPRLGGLVNDLRLTCRHLVPQQRIVVIGLPEVKSSDMELKDRARDELAASLLHCVNLTSLDIIGHDLTPDVFPLPKILAEPSIQHTLRQLVISGPSSVGLPASDVSLPLLEVLRLHVVYLTVGYTFPVLPAVDTLQLVHCRVVFSDEESSTFAEHSSDILDSLSIDIAQFPSLQVLDLHENDFALKLSKDLAKNIIEVRYTGWIRLLQNFPFPAWLKTAPSLRRLITTTYLWSREHLDPSFTSALERLTLLCVDAEDDSTGEDGFAKALDSLYDVVVSSQPLSLRCIALFNELAIEITADERRMEVHDDGSTLITYTTTRRTKMPRSTDQRQLALARLKAICVEKNVAVEEVTYGREMSSKSTSQIHLPDLRRFA
ncbi:hypothetical protein EIP91_006812 [Steccherinum ochraceum]|uniref:F-box domain-containing protein n=1 Tax=Steccherinum ochraceum TaxID=92696 RepID=A0A4R0R550_9APHY|nr:hypothetical protein EIP91_006812 [Steccherinum ochraceum]